jgi:hypothetical protein
LDNNKLQHKKDVKMREKLLNAFKSHAKGHIDKHVANVEVYLTNPAGIGDHPDIMEAIETEIKQIAEYDDMLEMVEKYFV